MKTLRSAGLLLALGFASLGTGCAEGARVDRSELESAATESSGLSDPDAWVHALYADVLGREPDDGGLAYWAGRLEDGTPPFDVALAFFDSEEWRTRYLSMLYDALLRRAPDADGLAFHMQRLEAGLPLDDVFADFLASDEYFAQQCGSDRRAFVAQLYQDVLGRQGASGEIDGWVGSGAGRHDIARGFVSSDEYRGRVIGFYYGHYLDRAAEEAGFQHWMAQVKGGMEWRHVASHFLSSEEYVALSAGEGDPGSGVPCGDVGEDGRCDGTVLSYCDGDSLETYDCADDGATCTEEDEYFDCF